MHLIVISEDFYPTISGGALVRWRFCELAAERGHRVTVFTSLTSGTPRREEVHGVEIFRPLPSELPGFDTHSLVSLLTRVLFSVPLFLYILYWSRDESIDGIHSASHSLHWIGKVLSVVFRSPLVTFVGYSPSQEEKWRLSPSFVRETVNFKFFMGENVFCQSPRIKQVIETYSDSHVEILQGILNEAKIRSVAGSVKREKICTQLGLPIDRINLAMVGRLVEIKNLEGALDIIQELPPKFHLVLVGDGPKREQVETEIARREISDMVTILGELSHKQALSVIAIADGLLLPSHSESHGAVAYEALAFKTPVYARPVGALPEIKHENLFIGDLSHLTSKLRELQPKKAISLDEEVVRQYSLAEYASRILHSFEVDR